jgi:hypothetical protein
MNYFTCTINNIEFGFHGFMEGEDEVCRVTVDNQNFKMIVNESGNWVILQQVPNWIKNLEGELAGEIEKAYC